MIDYRVYLVTDDPSRYRGDWIENVIAAVKGGVTVVQYRDTESAYAAQLERVRRLKAALRPFGIPLVINNDAHLAAAVGAEGVHVGQGDMPPEEVRAIVGEDVEIGLSLTDISQVDDRLMERIANGTVNAVGIGPVWDATKTKADASAAMGVEGFRAIADKLPRIPKVAIGGITLANAAEIFSAGADGVAVVSAFSRAADPSAVATEFSAVSKRGERK